MDLSRREGLFTVVCRPALPMDTPDVMALTRTIWDGHDYVPEVWAEWLADAEGMLAVAEYGGHAVGLSKLARLSPVDWWIQGLRVHPELQGRGIASRLHDYVLDYWQQAYGGTLRLATASFRKSVQHLCERSGFRKAGEFSRFEASTLPLDGDEPQAAGFRPIQAAEIEAALAFIQASPALPLNYGLLDLGWEWAQPSEYFLAQAVENGLAWWWRPKGQDERREEQSGGEGLLLGYEDEVDSGQRLSVSLAVAPPERLAGLLIAARRLAGALDRAPLRWLVPLHPEMIPVIAAAGFERQWEDSAYVYEKMAPQNMV